MPHNAPFMANLNETEILEYSKAMQQVESEYMSITAAIEAEDFENAVFMIWNTAEKLFMMNQFYTSDLLELALLHIGEKLAKTGETAFTPNDNTVLYYDRVASDELSFTPQYLDALGSLGLHIVYLTPYTEVNNIPKIKHILKNYNGELKTFRRESMLGTYNQICDAIAESRPKYATFYSMPQDAPGALAFMRFKGSVIRYFFDVTDYAFWLGRNSCDYFLETRDYGASLAYLYRGIPKNKILKFANSLEFSLNLPFQGFPFEKDDDDFIIFASGAPYKTEDDELTFYTFIANLLARYKNAKFWYAFQNDTVGMKTLTNTFSGRIFNTGFRKDLTHVLKGVELCLNTYPMFDTNMMLSAVHASHPPFTLKLNDESDGILKNQKNLGIEFDSPAKIFNAVCKYMDDEEYKNELKNKMKEAVYTKEEMTDMLRNALYSQTPYDFNAYDPKTSDFRAWYFKRYMNGSFKTNP